MGPAHDTERDSSSQMGRNKSRSVSTEEKKKSQGEVPEKITGPRKGLERGGKKNEIGNIESLKAYKPPSKSMGRKEATFAREGHRSGPGRG